ncbi:MAG: outer membrane lipoprotein carrier protein LolA [Cyclobacteriaceae bacterium]
MRKIAIVITLILGFGHFASAQYDPAAKEILDRVSNKYSNMNAFKADFVNKMENKEAGVDEEYGGIIYIKDDLFKVEMGSEIIYFDGAIIRQYDSDLQEYSIRIPEADMDSYKLSSVLELYKDGYKYRIREQNADGYIIELVPEDTNKSFHKLVMDFSKDYYIKSITYFEKNGNLISTIVKKTEEKPELTRSYFDFFKANLEVIDSVDMR